MLSFIYTLSSERGEDTALCFYYQSMCNVQFTKIWVPFAFKEGK